MPAYLSCPLCIKNTLSDVQELQKKIASALSRSLHCPICSAALQGLPSLHFHLATHIPMHSGFQTLSVSASPEHIPSLEKLDIRDEANSPNKLSENGIAIAVSSNKDDDANTQLKSIQYNCEFCGLVFSSEYFLTLHKDIMHSDINEFEVECKQCKSRFKNLEAYRDHVKEVHSDRRYICDQCPKSFKIKGGLLVHTRMFHDQSSPSTCQVCKKNFTSKARKELHERRYHGTETSTKKPPLQCPKLNEKLNDLGEAKNCLENLMQETNQLNVSGSPQHPVLDSNADSPPVAPLHSISTAPVLQPKVNSQVQSHQGKKIKSHQAMGRQVSCPPVIFPNYEGENTTSINNLLVNKEKFLISNEVEGKCDLWKNETVDGVQTQKQSDYEKEKPNVNCSEVSSTAVASIHFNNISYSIPKYNELQLRSFLPISPLMSPGSLNAQAFLQNSNYSSLPEINKCVEENTKTFQDHSNATHKHPEQSLRETQNIYSNFQQPVNLLNEIANSGTGLPFSNESSTPDNAIKIPTDYTITLPPSVNMNISCLVNTINSPTNLINKMKNTLDKLSPSSQEPESPGTNNNQNANQANECDQGSPNKDEQKKQPKISVKKANFSNRGSESKQWECEECKKSFTTKYFLKKHKRLHTGETPYSCEECGKTFTFQQSYHKHVFYHSDDKPHICPHCNRAFKEMSTLHNHVRIHTGEKPFVCTTCGKSFRQRVSYLVHQRIHTGILPYRCDVCNRAFRYKVSLRSHKCEGRNMGESSSNISKRSEAEDYNSESSPQNGLIDSQNYSPSSRQNRSKEKSLDRYHQSISQKSATNPPSLCFQAVTDHSTNNMNTISSLQESSSPAVSPGSLGPQKSNVNKYTESNGSSPNSLPSYSEKSENQPSKKPLIYSCSDTELNESVMHNSIHSVIPPHTNAKILPSQVYSQEHENDLLSDSSCLHSNTKYDHVSLPNININDSFSPMNLDEDLDNDTFLKSLFS